MFRRQKMLPFQVGLYFHDEVFRDVLLPGRTWIFDPLLKSRVERVSTDEVVFKHPRLREIAASGALVDRAVELDLNDSQRALVWVDGRFEQVLGPGCYALWTLRHDVRFEVVDARAVGFVHKELSTITRSESGQRFLDVVDIARDRVGVHFCDGRFVEVLAPGRYAFWRGVSETRVEVVDLREKMIDVVGQDVMTADKVTLRLNAVVAFKVEDPRRSVCASELVDQSLYREAQLVLRQSIGTRHLDELLMSKEEVAVEALTDLSKRVQNLGLRIVSVGLRDIVLPGEMKDLLNQVTQARKAAEANLIARREETAAIRSQANTAKLLDASPTLMRLRELEVLEKVASCSNLQVLMGNGESLTGRITKLI